MFASASSHTQLLSYYRFSFSLILCRALYVSLVLSTVPSSQAIKWIGLYRIPLKKMEDFTPKECKYARQEFGLNKRQEKFCNDNEKKFAMSAIHRAAQVVAFYCPQTFQDRRWNCSNIYQLPNVTMDINSGTREQAVVHAYGGAAILFEVARRCSDGKIQHCGCGQELTRRFNINNQNQNNNIDEPLILGCHDNIDMGKRYARAFLGFHRFLPNQNNKKRRKRRELNLKKLLNAHNYQAGIQFMEQNSIMKCQCHGLSGSCSQKTCFRQLTRLDTISLQEKLKQKYLEAKKVVRKGEMEMMKEVFKDDTFLLEPVESEELVFNVHSPDYCNRDPLVGSQGTQHRFCQPKSSPNHSIDCQNMCCHRGFHERHLTTKEKCNCRLVEGFSVICESCSVSKTTYHCN